MSRWIEASKFKARCVSFIDQVSQSGRPLVIAKRGKPIAELRPYRDKTKLDSHGPHPKNLFGIWKDAVVITGDIVSPISADVACQNATE